LHQESAGLEEWERNVDLKSRTAQRRCVGNDSDNIPVICSAWPLKTNAGRTFSTMPRSINQTSPRPGTLLLFVQHWEIDARALLNVFVRQGFAIKLPGNRRGLLSDALLQVPQQRVLIADGQCPDLFQHYLCFRTHACKIYRRNLKIVSRIIDIRARHDPASTGLFDLLAD
jgi:hypothetical protein